MLLTMTCNMKHIVKLVVPVDFDHKTCNHKQFKLCTLGALDTAPQANMDKW